MLSRQEFIQASTEINLFFQRIMKEHLFFIEISLQPVEDEHIAEANMLKQSFEQLLAETIYHADGIISRSVIKSNEIVTPYTLKAEQVNTKLTGASLNSRITKREYELSGIPIRAEQINTMLTSENPDNCDSSQWLENIVEDINKRSCDLVEEVIEFQKKLLSLSLRCKIFIAIYPEMLEHVTREAEYYREILKSLQDRRLPKKTLCDKLNFWNYIMGEHAEFIDGMLDPSEKDLKQTAETTAEAFERLVKECIRTAEKQIIRRSLESTEGIRDFKRASTEGLLNCKIKSIIPPLLADHVLREANHYLRLLKMM